MISAAAKRQLRVLLGQGIFKVSTRKGDLGRNELIKLLSQDESVLDSMQALYETVAETCPAELNMYTKSDPALGHVWYTVHNWGSAEQVKKAAISNFLNLLFGTAAWKMLKMSGQGNEARIRARFQLGGKSTFQESKPTHGGESYYGQPTPSDTKERHETQKTGDAVFPSNLSEEQGKGELVTKANPDALMQAQSVPIEIDIREAMTDLATFEPPKSQSYVTSIQPGTALSDQRMMQHHKTQATSGYRASTDNKLVRFNTNKGGVSFKRKYGTYQTPSPPQTSGYSTPQTYKRSRESNMEMAMLSELSTGPGNATEGKYATNVTSGITTLVPGGGPAGGTGMGAVAGIGVVVGAGRAIPAAPHGTPAPASATGSSAPTPPTPPPRTYSDYTARVGYEEWYHKYVDDYGHDPSEEEAQKFDDTSGTDSKHRPPPTTPATSGSSFASSLALTPITETKERESEPEPEVLPISKLSPSSFAPKSSSSPFKILSRPPRPDPEPAIKVTRGKRTLGDREEEGEKVEVESEGGSPSSVSSHIPGTKASYMSPTASSRAKASPPRAKHLPPLPAKPPTPRKKLQSVLKPAPAQALPTPTSKRSALGRAKDYSEKKLSLKSAQEQHDLAVYAEEEKERKKRVKNKGKGGGGRRGSTVDSSTQRTAPGALNQPVSAGTRSQGPRSGVKERSNSVSLVQTGSTATNTSKGPVVDAIKGVASEIRGGIVDLANIVFDYLKTRSDNATKIELAKLERAAQTEAGAQAVLAKLKPYVDKLPLADRQELEGQVKQSPQSGGKTFTEISSSITPSGGGLQGKKMHLQGGILDDIVSAGKDIYDLATSRDSFAGEAYQATSEILGGDTVEEQEAQQEFNETTNQEAYFMRLRGDTRSKYIEYRKRYGVEAAVHKVFPGKENQTDAENSFLEYEYKKLGGSYTWDDPGGYNTIKYIQLRRAGKSPQIAAAQVAGIIDENGNLSAETKAQQDAQNSSFIETASGTGALEPGEIKYDKKGNPVLPGAAAVPMDIDPPDPAPAGAAPHPAPPGALPDPAPPPLLPGLPEAARRMAERVAARRAREIEFARDRRLAAEAERKRNVKGTDTVSYGAPETTSTTGYQPGTTRPVVPPVRNSASDEFDAGTDTSGGAPAPRPGGTDNTRASQREGALPNPGPTDQTYPTLRSFFKEGDANVVLRLNQNKKALDATRSIWHSFNDYDWENNQEADNGLWAMNIVDEARRFTGPLDKDSMLMSQAKAAIQESYDESPDVFSVPSSTIPDHASIQIDTRGGGNLTTLTEDETYSVFHPVYLPPWIDIPESSPWKKFTQIMGSQLTDAQIKNPERLTPFDAPSVRNENQFIVNTPA